HRRNRHRQGPGPPAPAPGRPRPAPPLRAANTPPVPARPPASGPVRHQAGAVTGPRPRPPGPFRAARGGPLVPGPVGDMPLALQTRLLRVLAAGEFYRVGGRELIRADVRVIAATHQDLDAKVERGEFRADLLHRLDVVRLHVPALRERSEDIALLAPHFLARAAALAGGPPKRFSAEALAALAKLQWPGNVRQLENRGR